MDERREGGSNGGGAPATSSTVASPLYVAVCCACPIVETGLTCDRQSVRVTEWVQTHIDYPQH